MEKPDTLLRLVIADDEPIIRARLVQTIDWESVGFAVCGEAANGRELLALLPAVQPDVILTDIRMPLMDGLELVETIQQDRLSDALIVVVTGFAEFDYAQRLLRMGVADYILKPIDKDKLYESFRRLHTRRLEEKAFKARMFAKTVTDVIFRDLPPEQAQEWMRRWGADYGVFLLAAVYADAETPTDPQAVQAQLFADLPDVSVQMIGQAAEGGMFFACYLEASRVEEVTAEMSGRHAALGEPFSFRSRCRPCMRCPARTRGLSRRLGPSGFTPRPCRL